jgi:hypothetical protein
MESSNTPEQIQSEFARVVARLDLAMGSCGRSMIEVLDTGTALAEEASTEVAHYYDPAMNRATLIAETAKELSQEILDSNKALVGFAGEYGTTALQTQQAVQAVQIQMLEGSMEIFNVETSDPRERLRQVRENLKNAPSDLSQHLESAIPVAGSLTTAATIAGLVVNRWQQQLDDYVEHAPPSGELKLLEALWEEIVDEGVFGVAEHILVEVVGMTGPAGSIIVGISKLVLNLRRKVAEREMVYARGSVDQMLDLAETMRAQREAMQEVLVLLQETRRLADLLLPQPKRPRLDSNQRPSA